MLFVRHPLFFLMAAMLVAMSAIHSAPNASAGSLNYVLTSVPHDTYYTRGVAHDYTFQSASISVAERVCLARDGGLSYCGTRSISHVYNDSCGSCYSYYKQKSGVPLDINVWDAWPDSLRSDNLMAPTSRAAIRPAWPPAIRRTVGGDTCLTANGSKTCLPAEAARRNGIFLAAVDCSAGLTTIDGVVPAGASEVKVIGSAAIGVTVASTDGRIHVVVRSATMTSLIANDRARTTFDVGPDDCP